MSNVSGRMELWRRLVLLCAVLLGLGLFFYVAPEMISITVVDWQAEQADELKSISGFVTQEDKRLSQLPLEEYIAEKTGGRITQVDTEAWSEFFRKVQLASCRQFAQSDYSDRVNAEDKDDFWQSGNLVPVFFKPDEIPYTEWGLDARDDAVSYIAVKNGSKLAYFKLDYEDYQSSVSAMYKPYRTAPGWLYHPYRQIGIGILAAGVLAYIFLPRRRKAPAEIAYANSRLIAGDIAALLLLLPFYGLPFLINGGTIQSLTGMWPVTVVMWLLVLFPVVMLYYMAWYGSYRIELSPEALSLTTFKGVQVCRFDQIDEVELISLRNPGWFRKLFLALAFLSIAGGGRSIQPAGSALLADSAAYGGLEIKSRGQKPIYIWFTDQMGGTIIPNFEQVPEALQAAGVRVRQEGREIEGFSMFM